MSSFFVLLQGFSHHADVMLPSNTNTLTVLQLEIIPDTPSEDEFVVNELYATLWMEQNTPTWYLGHYIASNPDATIKIEHCTNCESNFFKWKNPNVPDIAEIKTEDIIVCKIVGECFASNQRMPKYTLKNHEDIDRLVKE